MPKAASTINQRFAEIAQRYGARVALTAKDTASKQWTDTTYSDLASRVRRFSLGLRALGIERGDRVAILSENRPEWIIADLAILAAGGVSVPIYPTLPPGQVAYILQDSGATGVVASDAKQLEKVVQARANCPDLRVSIVMDTVNSPDAIHFSDVLERGDSAHVAQTFEERRDIIGPDDLMSIIYTSGTTGSPKGVMLTHGNMASSLDAGFKAFPQFTPPFDSFLSFLPLCHIFERVVSLMALTSGARTYFNDSIFKIVDNMAALRPNIMVCVPRVFESIHERIEDGVAKAPAMRRKMFGWALRVGDIAAQRRNAGRLIGPMLAIQRALAEKLVLSKVRARFGGHLKFFVSGGAPLNPRTAHFFNAVGLPILEVWGLTETALATSNPVGRAKVGTVGKAGAGIQVKAAPDGELLIKSAGVMQGYWHLPEATAEAIDKDGWFHSGDIGEIDSEGYVKITDRKKDILVLANGKKVAPQPIETLLKHSPYITEIVLLGDKSDTVRALVAPNFDALKTWAKGQGMDKPTNEALIADPAVRKLIKSEIDSRSRELADFEKVKRFALIDHAFSIENGELTPTLKVKRKVVAEKYGSLLERE